MKSKLICFLTFFSIIIFSNFRIKDKIGNCFISFTTPTNLTAISPDRLPETSEKIRKIKVDTGFVEITRIDGYRVLYNNSQNIPFVNLKIELSEHKSSILDKERIIENLKYINSHSKGMETNDLIELEFNGFKILGFNRNTIENGSTLGTFVLFTDEDVVVYFYFNNMKPESRHFVNIEEYKKCRNQFLDEYTKHLSLCRNK